MIHLSILKSYPWLFSLCFLTVIAPAQNYYVSADKGDNRNDGLSVQTAWQEIPYAIDSLKPGDVLTILEGTYPGKINVHKSGTLKKPIVIKSQKGHDVYVEGQGLGKNEFLMKIEDQKHIVIQGLKFRDYQKLDAQGLLIENSSYISILSNEFSDIDYRKNAGRKRAKEWQNSQPLIVYGSNANQPVKNLIIRDNIIRNCEVGQSECLAVNGNVDSFEIVGNKVFDNTNIGIDVIGFEKICEDEKFDQPRNGLILGNHIYDCPSTYDPGAGIYIDGAKDIIIEQNFSYRNDYGIEVGCENARKLVGASASGIVVRNNVVYRNELTGIALGGLEYEDESGQEHHTMIRDCVIRNNTCFGNDTKGDYNGEVFIKFLNNVEIHSNIFYADNERNVLLHVETATTGLKLFHNLFYSTRSEESAFIQPLKNQPFDSFQKYKSNPNFGGPSSKFANPKFKDITSKKYNFLIQAGSGAIDTGLDSLNARPIIGKTELDMQGQERLKGKALDCGAYELK